MRTATSMIALALVAMAAAPAAAELPVGSTAREIYATEWLNVPGPVSLQALRGRIVVVEFWATWCGPCRTSIPHLNELHKQYAKQGVVIIGLTRETGTSIETFVRQMGMEYVVGLGSRSDDVYGVGGIPHAWVIDPSGKVTWHGHPASGLDGALERQLRETPPSLMDPKAKAACLKLLDQVDAAMGEKNYRVASVLLRKLERPEDDAEVETRVEAVREKLGEVAEAGLAGAEAMVKKEKFYEASVMYQGIATFVPGSPAAEKATAALAALMKDPKARAAIDAARKERAAAEALAGVPTEVGPRTVETVLAKLDAVAKAHPGTQAGADAQARAEALRGNAELMQAAQEAEAEQQCSGWLSMARNYIKAGLPDKARPHLEKVIAEYGSTAYAEEARAMLKELDG